MKLEINIKIIKDFIKIHNKNKDIGKSFNNILEARPSNSTNRAKQSSLIRTFLMSLTEEIAKRVAEKYGEKIPSLKNGTSDSKYKSYLKSKKILTGKESKYFNSLYSILSSSGSHKLATSKEKYNLMLYSSLNLILLILVKSRPFLPKEKSKAKIIPAISEYQFKKLMEVSKKQKYRLAYVLSFTSGLNISEVVNLKQKDIDINSMTLYTNGDSIRSSRTLPLNISFKKDHLKLLPLKIKQRAIQKKFISDCEKAGLMKESPNMQFRSLRKGYVQNLMDRKYTMYEIQKLIGNKRLSATTKLMQEIKLSREIPDNIEI